MVAVTTVIPPGHEAIVLGTVSTGLGTGRVGMIEPIEGDSGLVKKGQEIDRTLVSAEPEGKLPLRVLHPGLK